MDFYLLGQSLSLPLPTTTGSDPHLSFFEDTFDYNTLRKFYNIKDSPSRSVKSTKSNAKIQKGFVMDEDAMSLSLDALSPSTTAQSNTYSDSFQQNYSGVQYETNLKLNSYSRSQSSLSPASYKGPLAARPYASNGPFTANQSPEKPAVLKKNHSLPQGPLISNLLQDIKGFYGQENGQVNKMELYGTIPSRTVSSSYILPAEQNLDQTIIKKLIKKQNVFTINRKKKGTKESVNKKSVITQSPAKMKKVELNLSKTSLPTVEMNKNAGYNLPQNTQSFAAGYVNNNMREIKFDNYNQQMNMYANNNTGNSNMYQMDNARKFIMGNMNSGVQGFAPQPMKFAPQ